MSREYYYEERVQNDTGVGRQQSCGISVIHWRKIVYENPIIFTEASSPINPTGNNVYTQENPP